ncbi:type II/IV secretion system protein [Nitrogeniibacter mangrovi]|uniref:Type II/IV secretion system protein n=1 Tax=Nitrogeniibacter mangrovi TaxID=2016596 RepID=A0A6C1B9G7_9RHOO|nr:GspE/PulE family protein [Nitrogeniibacter mangrovi]QID19388.1 type II/IV secretion system protein [Nitrogeniibacter mangrovi]
MDDHYTANVEQDEDIFALAFDAFVGTARLSPESLERIRAAALHSSLPPSSVSVKLGLLSELEVAEAMANAVGEPLLRRADFPALPLEIDDLNQTYLEARHVVPISIREGSIEVAMANPLDATTRSGIEFAVRRSVKAFAALESEIADFHAEHAPKQNDSSHEDGGGKSQQTQDDLVVLSDQSSDAPVIQLVNRLITSAVDGGASDIHLEPRDSGMSVRYRVDGELKSVETLSGRWMDAVASRIKLLSQLDIAERRLPQDGRMRFVVRGQAVDLRVASFPSLNGESIVLRILGRNALGLDLNHAGLSQPGLSALTSALSRPHGIILITGPTGSGKTTTLYAALKHILRPELKVITVEDPVEYTLPGVVQQQVRQDIGLTYPIALRSMLRNDPDVIMIGEIRDGETADIAIRAALTGHLVLATLHTNTAAGAITRLLDLGVESFLLASTLSLTSAQRLVRRLCVHCRHPRPATVQEQAWFKSAGLGGGSNTQTLYDPTGCLECSGKGFAGRVPLFEALNIGDPERELIRQWEGEARFERQHANRANGLWEHGVDRVLSGETTFAELLKVVPCPTS